VSNKNEQPCGKPQDIDSEVERNCPLAEAGLTYAFVVYRRTQSPQ
jgi:hypothetical protein